MRWIVFEMQGRGLMQQTKITTKYQITLPKEVRQAMNLKPGEQVSFKAENGRYYLVKNTQTNPIEKWRGTLRSGKRSDELVAELRGYGSIFVSSVQLVASANQWPPGRNPDEIS
ncbi:MAG: AbrB/MazE/SpoVT family DNA-binding domain-containing protein [Desulfobacterales bacterium]|nr:AbrB/MazE/SpoVT family DNA-binding domain-containing protein [Desulfobacterales bacterium]